MPAVPFSRLKPDQQALWYRLRDAYSVPADDTPRAADLRTLTHTGWAVELAGRFFCRVPIILKDSEPCHAD